ERQRGAHPDVVQPPGGRQGRRPGHPALGDRAHLVGHQLDRAALEVKYSGEGGGGDRRHHASLTATVDALLDAIRPMSPTSAVAVAGTSLAGAALWCGPGLAVHWPPVARALNVPLTLEHGGGVALTYDDGPHPEGTPAVLEALRRAEARATFFLVGEQVER